MVKAVILSVATFGNRAANRGDGGPTAKLPMTTAAAVLRQADGMPAADLFQMRHAITDAVFDSVPSSPPRGLP